jgi:hypothetical protein
LEVQDGTYSREIEIVIIEKDNLTDDRMKLDKRDSLLGKGIFDKIKMIRWDGLYKMVFGKREALSSLYPKEISCQSCKIPIILSKLSGKSCLSFF